ncbi:MAG: MFS transporter [Anaerolineae bacterium]|nr:MFS transporter [Anaerolineae bacterium]MDQ7035143.1 MFS transporter [Anaerolineae bacterium]
MTQQQTESKSILDKRLIVILLIVLVQMIGAAMVFPILPLYAKREFGMQPQTITLLITAFFAAQFIAGPFIGRLSDKYGRVPILIMSQIGTVIAFLILGLSGQVWMLFFARILDGITGGNIIVAQAYVTDIIPRERRTEALGYVFAAFGVGFIVGPAVGGLLSTYFTYQTPYFVAAAAATIVVILTWFMLEETVTPEVRAENKQKRGQSMNVGAIVKNLPLISILLMAFGSQFAFSMLQSTFSLFGEAVLFADNPERAELGVGLLLATVGVGQIFTQLYLVKKLAKRFGDSPLVIIGGVIRSISMFVLVILAVPASAAVTLFLFAMGTGMQMPALQSLVTNTVPDNQRGGVLGLYQSSLSLSIIFGSAISGAIFEIAPIVPYIVGGSIFALMLIPAFFLVQWVRQQEESQKINLPQSAPVGH